MMKALVTLEGLLLLLFSWLWMCSGQNSVLVECSQHHFRVVAKRALFYEDELVGPDELSLGTGCIASQMRPDELEFNYPINLCGIIIEIFLDGTVLHSWLTYRPKNQLISAELHLQCKIPSSHVPPDVSQARIRDPSSIQQWFLVQYRYCLSCGCIHLRDNWSTPFYGIRNQSLQRPFYSSPDLYNFKGLCSWTSKRI